MENASQALLIAGGVLIAILVISLGVYIFGTASSISEEYDRTMSATEISKFNAKFEGYEKNPYYAENDVQTNPNLPNYKPLVKYTGSENVVKNNKENYSFTNYNSISDVVSAMNLAYTINAKNNYDVQTGVQVCISGLKKDSDWLKYDGTTLSGKYGVTPLIQKLYDEDKANKNKDKNMMYFISDPNEKSNNNTKPTKLIPLNFLLENFSESKLQNGAKRVYKYGFKGEVSKNSETGLIDIIKFSLIENVTY